MRHWHRQFLGRTELPPELSALAISEFFSLSRAESQALLSRYGADMRLGAALQIGFSDAVMSGRLSATKAIELQGAALRGEPGFRAGHAHGLLLRTNDLLRSYTDADYRREKLHYLNHNERTHQLQRQIRHAGSGSARGRRGEELVAQSHCLALCTNLVMAHNTSCHRSQLLLSRRGARVHAIHSGGGDSRH